MAHNSIRAKRAELGITQADLSVHMPDGVNSMCLSYIETGRVLPTREGSAMMYRSSTERMERFESQKKEKNAVLHFIAGFALGIMFEMILMIICS